MFLTTSSNWSDFNIALQSSFLLPYGFSIATKVIIYLWVSLKSLFVKLTQNPSVITIDF